MIPNLGIFIGGGLGSMCRFVHRRPLWNIAPAFPLGTLAVSFLSCVVMAIVLVRTAPDEDCLAKYLLLAGFCGGSSTFSTFSYGTGVLFRTGSFWAVTLNIFINLLACTMIFYFTSKNWL